MLNSAGQQEIAVGESTEAGAYGWTKAINDALRVAGGGGGGVIAGAGLTLTGSTLDVGAADSTIQVNANSIQALPANIVTASTVTTALGALSASVSVNSQKITTLADPTSAQDAATKNYVDGLLTTLDLKTSVRVATESTLLSVRGADHRRRERRGGRPRAGQGPRDPFHQWDLCGGCRVVVPCDRRRQQR